jgi:hypothetical protein
VSDDRVLEALECLRTEVATLAGEFDRLNEAMHSLQAHVQEVRRDFRSTTGEPS